MATKKLDKQIVAEISKYRAICLIHRYCYYVKSSPLISDQQYDIFERKLKALVTQHPQLAFEADNQSYCPTQSVGSDNPDDYPRRIEQLAESLLENNGKTRTVAPELPILSCPVVPSA